MGEQAGEGYREDWNENAAIGHDCEARSSEFRIQNSEFRVHISHLRAKKETKYWKDGPRNDVLDSA